MSQYLMANFLFPHSDPSVIVPGASNLLNRLLENRDVTTETADAFLSPDYSTLHNPRELHDIDVAVSRIKQAITNNECIAIFSDYDCDGIPGAVVLHDFFKSIPYKHFLNYIPHRHYEGFGLSNTAVDALHEKGVKLIITIDCGTSDVEPVKYANKKGIDVIITDHHEPGARLPDATAIVNPKLGKYPFAELCGAAVVFKLVQVLLEETEHNINPGQEKWWLDMVGIATIADMVPLVGENRVLAHFGLTVLRKSRRPGLQQLLKKNRVNQQYVTEEDIGFTIGPRINAASRMDTPEDAFQLLTTTDEVEAGEKVTHLEKLNTERKTIVAGMTRELHSRMKDIEEVPDVIVLGNPEWRPSLVGLTASKLAEEHNKPVFVWGRDGNEVYKGSCRSGGGVSVVKLMEAATAVFIEHGGHHFSGGFSVKEDKIFTFGEALNKAYVDLGEAAAISEEVVVDEYLKLEEVYQVLIRELGKLAPYGVGNRKPVFAFKDVVPRKVEEFGKGKEHVKLTYESNNGTLEAIAFFATAESYSKTPKVGSQHTLIANVEESFFMGRRQIRMRIIDII